MQGIEVDQDVFLIPLFEAAFPLAKFWRENSSDSDKQ